MKTIGIVPNTYKDINYEFTSEVVDWVFNKNHRPLVTENVGKEIGKEMFSKDIEEIYLESDLILVLGGDGSVLRAAKYAAIKNKLILGINLGTLGYLTDVEKKDCFLALTKYLEDEYVVEKRMMIEAYSDNIEFENGVMLALNDICISRGAFSSLITIELFVNNEFIDIYRGDGIIISTPTGSTAYNLSAGGPILKPDSRMIAITPVCPHMLHSRPFIISSDDTITIKAINKRPSDILLYMDGQNITPIKDQDVINIKTSTYHTNIVKTNKLGFYDVLRKKMVGQKDCDE